MRQGVVGVPLEPTMSGDGFSKRLVGCQFFDLFIFAPHLHYGNCRAVYVIYNSQSLCLIKMKLLIFCSSVSGFFKAVPLCFNLSKEKSGIVCLQNNYPVYVFSDERPSQYDSMSFILCRYGKVCKWALLGLATFLSSLFLPFLYILLYLLYSAPYHTIRRLAIAWRHFTKIWQHLQMHDVIFAIAYRHFAIAWHHFPI